MQFGWTPLREGRRCWNCLLYTSIKLTVEKNFAFSGAPCLEINFFNVSRWICFVSHMRGSRRAVVTVIHQSIDDRGLDSYSFDVSSPSIYEKRLLPDALMDWISRHGTLDLTSYKRHTNHTHPLASHMRQLIISCTTVRKNGIKPTVVGLPVNGLDHHANQAPPYRCEEFYVMQGFTNWSF